MRNSLYIKILRLGFPILIGQLGSIVVGFADTAMVGRYATEALASASFVNNVFNVVIFATLGFAYGLTPLIGALFSQKRYGRIGALMRSAVAANVLFALLVSAIMGAVYLNIDRLGQPEELLPLIRPYFLIVLSGLIPFALFNTFAQWSYAINRTRMPMWIILAANALNILGNYLLIYGNWGCPELGLNGAGIATLTARLVCAVAIILIFMYRKRYREYSDGFRKSRISWSDVLMVVKASWPVSAQMTFESGSFTVAAVMAGWIGSIALAAFQVTVMLGTLGFCVYYSLAAAVAVLVSNAAGLSDRPLMRRTAMSGYVILMLFATCSSLIFWMFGADVIRVFTHDAEVLALGMTLIVPLMMYQYGDATQITFANSLRGTANVMPMMWISFVSYIVVGIPATYILGFTAGLGLYGILLSFSVSLFLAGGLFLYCFIHTTRR